jgi:pimeloyl-ACP methyl ester carboxylesterase
MPFANNNGVKIHYEVEGQGPSLILQHGFGGSTTSWYGPDYAHELSKDYRLIMVDARGHGKSDKPHSSEAYRADIIAKDYTAILDALKLDKASYFGYSMGGAIGFQCIARYALPRFDSLIIGGASPYGDVLDADKEEGRERLDALRMSVLHGMEYYLVNFLEKMTGPLPKVARDQRLASDPSALLAIAEAISTWPSAQDILPSINIPIMVFCGELDPRFPNVQKCITSIPTATFLSLSGEDHVQVQNDVKGVLAHVKTFLAEVNKN